MVAECHSTSSEVSSDEVPATVAQLVFVHHRSLSLPESLHEESSAAGPCNDASWQRSCDRSCMGISLTHSSVGINQWTP